MKKSKLDRTPSPFDEVGVDVAKLKLDISIGTNLFTVPNTDKGIAGLLDQIQPATGTRVSLEATGAYTRNLIKACLGRQIPVSLLNARYVRNYARCSGQLAKTDAIDARVIAGYAKDYDPKLLRLSG